MKTEGRARSNIEVCFGVLLIVLAVLGTTAMISYSPYDNCFFVRSAEPTVNLLGLVGAYAADMLVQFFGFLSYLIMVVLAVWGVNFINGKIHYIKSKAALLVSFIALGSIVFNITSTCKFCSDAASDLDYYAGGYIGYVLSKIIFIDILRQGDICGWIFFAVVVIWLIFLKTVLFIDISALVRWSHRRAQALLLLPAVKARTKKLRRSNVVWETRGTSGMSDSPGDTSTPTKRRGRKPQDEQVIGAIPPTVAGIYSLPSVELLEKHSEKEYKQDEGKIAVISAELRNVLEEFGINGEVLNVRQGPVVTMFEFRPAPGIKTSRIISLSDDIARSMKAISARIAIIPGQNAIGIELPNKNRHTVYLSELLSSEAYRGMTTGIPLILGKDISGNPIMADLAKMPHLLIAGTTGSGKSVSVNAMILSILYRFTPKDCKLIMIDPKMLELSVYDEIPHLLTPVVTDPKKAIFALKWAVAEMENRYRQMSKLGVRNIDGFNKKLAESKEKGDLLVRKVQTGFEQETGKPIFEIQQFEFEEMPYIVVIVDEMADLMLVAGKDVESAIQRLAQMARAAGIHLIMATQRPSVDVITGTIKANFPTRVSFQVTSKIDSRTILGEQGAEQLLGQGDMLYMSGAGRIQRVHGPFVKDSEVERIVEFIRNQEEPSYVDIVGEQSADNDQDLGFGDQGASSDEMYTKAIEVVANDRKCSISYLQRKLQIGYNRAARIIEEMETKGLVSAPNHTGKREILI
jgi:S-DNA-T family DNA segregation ATPase FtsK/SpoIIIE